MIWTTEKPTAPGWYWHKGIRSNKAVVVCVEPCGSSLGCRYAGDEILYTIPDDSDRGYHGEWSSTPVPEPEEQP